MQKTFTPEDVIRFAYQEMDAFEAESFTREMADCEETAQQLNRVNEMRDLLDVSAGQPHRNTIQTLLRYSRSLRIEKTADGAMDLEMMLN
jgi:hypothetical protein